MTHSSAAIQRDRSGPEYYYSGGGELIAVTDLESARAAIRLISEQGEGLQRRHL